MLKLNVNFVMNYRFAEIVKIIFNTLSFIKSNNDERKLISECLSLPFVRTDKNMLWNNLNSFKFVLKKNGFKNMVEIGVGTGHGLVFFQKLINLYNLIDSKIYGYDTFEGVPVPTDRDIASDGKLLKDIYKEKIKKNDVSGWNNNSLDYVKKIYSDNTKNNNNLTLIKGKVEETLRIKENLPENISLLRIDLELYEATKFSIEKLVPNIVNGGILMVDNYSSYSGVKDAFDEYFKNSKYKIHYSTISRRKTVYF
jgi:O-methyltransferase